MTPMRAMAALIVLLLLLVPVATPAPVGYADEDERPDLQIEVVGLQSGSQRDVVVRVTNISAWWSDRTTATVETLAPTAGGAQTFDIPDLNTADEAPLPDTYEFTYTLAHDCNGDVVKASLSSGTNYEGVEEANLDNNQAQLQVCGGANAPALPQGVTAPGVKPQQVSPGSTGPAKSDVRVIDQPAAPGAAVPVVYGRMLAAAPAPGPHMATLPLSISLRRGADATFHGGFHAAECFPVSISNLEPKFVVGWGEYEWFGSPCMADVYQVAVSFDKGELAQAPDGTSVDRVILGYDEIEMPTPFCNGVVPGLGLEDPDISSRCWRSGGGKPEPKPNGCVVLRVPATEWRNNEFPHGLMPAVNDPRAPRLAQVSPREWDVTDVYRWQNVANARPLTPPGQAPAPSGFGFLLAGAGDINELQGEDSTSCVSWVTNVHLTVSYTVPTPGRGPVVR